ncbi:DUF6286 domain-containing protein [Streptomyces sp. NPDC056638]|uniref:DUF6286 domain-containing protein n=1 Tax=Streptomyces sp. NPDC056638 TaxID=3345887 RepID=UPI0036840BE0
MCALDCVAGDLLGFLLGDCAARSSSDSGDGPAWTCPNRTHGVGREAALGAPAAVVALLSVAAIGLLLYDVVSVRADRPGMSWRRRLAEELATRPLHDIWMTVGAAVAMALGLWLFLLAVTPGLRRLLPMRHPTGIPGTGEVRAGLDRHAAALILRDRAVRVSGVQSARVDVGRRKVKARAQAHFRDLNEVHADLDAALSEAATNLGLAQQPTLDVRIRRPK